MKKRSLLLVCLVACIAFAIALAREKPAPQADPKAELIMAADRGKALWNDTSLGTNGKSCAACHTDAAGLAGVTRTFPKYQRMADIVAYMAKMAPGKEMMAPKDPTAGKETKKTEQATVRRWHRGTDTRRGYSRSEPSRRAPMGSSREYPRPSEGPSRKASNGFVTGVSAPQRGAQSQSLQWVRHGSVRALMSVSGKLNHGVRAVGAFRAISMNLPAHPLLLDFHPMK